MDQINVQAVTVAHQTVRLDRRDLIEPGIEGNGRRSSTPAGPIASYGRALAAAPEPAKSPRNRKFADSPLEGSGFERWVPRDMGYGFGPSCLRHPRHSSSAARREHPAAPAALNVVGTPAPIPSLTRSRSALCLQVRPQSLPSDAASHRACQSREAGDNMSAKGMI